jgi:hypothetical protein
MTVGLRMTGRRGSYCIDTVEMDKLKAKELEVQWWICTCGGWVGWVG